MLNATIRSLIEKDTPSRAALEISGTPVPLVSPTRDALTSEFQYGVPIPVKKGNKKTSLSFSNSFTFKASVSTSFDSLKKERLSLSH